MEDEQEKKSTLAIFEFEWELTNTQNKTGTILSKMIEFRGEKLFRVGLKNQGSVGNPYTQSPSSTLLFMITDLAKIGLKVEAVLYDVYNSSGRTMKKMDLQLNHEAEESRNGKVQLFTYNLNSYLIGDKSYKFLVYISGVVEEYQFHQKDFLINEQFWLSAQNQVGTDFKITDGKKIFSVHKFVLVARRNLFGCGFNLHGTIFEVLVHGRVGGGHQQSKAERIGFDLSNQNIGNHVRSRFARNG